MANALPLLLVGGAALLLMGRKKSAPAASGKEPPTELDPLPATTEYPPEPGRVFEALNIIQLRVVSKNLAAFYHHPGILLFYNPDNPASVSLRTVFGRIAAGNPDVSFTAIPLSFVEYMVEEGPEEFADFGEYIVVLKSGAYDAIIDAAGHDTGVKSDPEKFREEMTIALEVTRKEIKRKAGD